METKSKKAVIYCRVSTKEQVDEGNSLISQQNICKEYALKNGYEISDVFIEQGESAKNADRTQLKRLIEYCTDKRNGVQAVIAYKVDRIARNIDDYRYIRVLLKRYGVEIKSTSEYFEDTPAGRFMENIIANVAQFDNDVRTERCAGGMRDAMREGRYVWAAPFGYSNVKVLGKSTIGSNEKADVVKQLFQGVATNEKSIAELRTELYKKGLATTQNKMITKSYLYKMLNNQVYTGWIIKFGERHKGLFEPIISEELFEQVQRVLKRRAHKRYSYKVENPDFPLKRFVFHPTGIKATGYWAKGRYKKYPYYRFIGVKHGDIKKELLEDSFLAFLDSHILNEKHIAYLKTAMSEALNGKNSEEFKEGEKLRAQIAELNAKQTSLIDKNEKNVISDAVLRKQLDMIEEKLTEATAALYKLPESYENIDELFEDAKEFLQNPSETWLKASFKKRVELQWFEFPKGVLLKDGKFRTTEIASIFKTKEVLAPLLSINVDSKGQVFEQTTSNKSPPFSYIEYAKEIQRLAEILREKPP